MSGLNAISTSDPMATADPMRQQQLKELRQQVDKVVGGTFFAEMLKIARNSSLKGKYGHGGRGEEIFMGQMHMRFAFDAAQRMQTDLGDRIYNDLAKRI
jgi:hypothetical protein